MQARLSLPWESARVLRPLWTEFPAQTVRVHSLQKSADAVLVSIHESGDDICSRALQLAAGSVPAAAACNGGPRENAVSRVVVVRSESGDVWMGAAGNRLAGLGLFRVERCPAQGQGLVYPQTADVFSRGRGGAAAAVVDSRGAASVAILRDDWAASGRTYTARLGRRAGCDYPSLHRSRVARLFAGARKNAEPRQHRGASTGADDDGGRLVAYLLSDWSKADFTS